MSERETDLRKEEGRREEEGRPGRAAHERPEEAERPAPGIRHEHEPDAENIMPAEDRPGTF
ncbi:MAG TPA: hypothetical protein VK421_01080 [Pyrinomonadaceae bacterium]|nr:hypothetical protein [Pyrinomonadaceae bacterium]